MQLFGTISSEEDWWTEDCVTYRNFINELNTLGVKDTINVSIQSGGGDVFAANAIKTALEMNSAKIVGTIIGLCASAATIILTACDTRRIANNGILMAHNPKITLYGAYESAELTKLAEVTDKVKQSIVTAYMQILSKTEEEVVQLMNDETWYVGQEAVDAGFCNELISGGESFQNNAMGDHKNFMVNGKHYNFTNYVETVVPDNIRKKVLNLSPTPQKEEGTFFNTTKQKGNKNMGENNQTATPITDVAQLRAAYPEFCNSIAKDAVKAERERMKAIDAVSKGIPDDVLAKAKYEEPMSAQDLAYAQMVANSKVGNQTLENVVDDLQNSGTGDVTTVPNVGNDTTGQKKEEKEAKVHGFANALKGDKRRGTK